MDGGTFPSACVATPTCECAAGVSYGECEELDGGGIEFDPICPPCYGSPPARLERLAHGLGAA